MTQRKNQRIALRLNEADKALIAAAAEYSGQTLTQFMVSCAVEHARRLVPQPPPKAP